MVYHAPLCEYAHDHPHTAHSIGVINQHACHTVAIAFRFGNECVKFWLAPVCHNYAGALTCESCRDCAPQCAAAPSDQCDFILKAKLPRHGSVTSPSPVLS